LPALNSSSEEIFLCNTAEDQMPTFMLSLNWTDQGIRKVKDAPKRNKAAKELAKKVGIEIKHVYLTSGDDASFSLSIPQMGTTLLNSRSRSARWETCVPEPSGLGLSPNFSN